MIEWALILMPLLVLPIALLFRFVGCAQIAGLEEPTPVQEPEIPLPPRQPPPEAPPLPKPVDTKPPNYSKYILGELNNPGQVKNPKVQPNGADVIAYWRLVDLASEPPLAVDLKNFQPGNYKQGDALPPINPTPTTAGSEGRDPGHFIFGQKSLIDSEPKLLCRDFQGGYVLVNYKPGLHSDEFTIEAWIEADALAPGFDHTLFDAGGLYAYPAGTPSTGRGFTIFANRNGFWQMRLGQSTAELFLPSSKVPLGKRTHLAVTVESVSPGSVQRNIRLYVDGKDIDVGGPGVKYVSVNYVPPYEAPLFIGLENTAPLPTGAPNLRAPVLCRIQEVVLHRKALSKEEIENHVDINRPQ
jgi:hypothetical protein